MTITPGILFDLDGTLLDTGPDLAYTLNTVLKRYQRTPLPYSQIRPVITQGMKGLAALGFGAPHEHPPGVNLIDELLACYQNNLARETQLFPGIDDLLMAIEEHGWQWGIVTNKEHRFTEPLLKQLGLWSRASCVISGDTLALSKPHPEPLWHACQLLGRNASECVYVGDSRVDAEAGQRAGMHTIIVSYGYRTQDDNPHHWGAHACVDSPSEIQALLPKTI